MSEKQLRLEWMSTASGGLAWVYLGPLYMEVDIDGHWHIQCASGDRPRGKATDLASAQLAAESAAVDLLCSSLAAFADGDPIGDVVRVDGTNCPGAEAGHANVCAYDFQGAWTVWLGLADPDAIGDTSASIAFAPEAARSLALSLLAALRDTGETANTDGKAAPP